VRQLLKAAAAVLPGCGLMALAIAGTDTADGHCVTVTGNGSPVVFGRAGADGGTVTDTPGFEGSADSRPHRRANQANQTFRDCAPRRGRSQCVFRTGL
jgi:hypothetical protein